MSRVSTFLGECMGAWGVDKMGLPPGCPVQMGLHFSRRGATIPIPPNRSESRPNASAPPAREISLSHPILRVALDDRKQCRHGRVQEKRKPQTAAFVLNSPGSTLTFAENNIHRNRHFTPRPHARGAHNHNSGHIHALFRSWDISYRKSVLCWGL